MQPRKSVTRSQMRGEKSQAETGNQPKMAIAAEVVELQQVVPQQMELIHKQAEDTIRREEEFTCRHNQMLKAIIQSIPGY